jgi:hypothetical protein
MAYGSFATLQTFNQRHLIPSQLDRYDSKINQASLLKKELEASKYHAFAAKPVP